MKKQKVDKSQRVLIPKTMAETGPGIIVTPTASISLSEPVFCPFCIHLGKVQDFLISTKKGIDQYRCKCPECGEGMLIRTLTREFTPESFAEWIHNEYGRYFWRKVSFKQFCDHLHKIGWSYRFWHRYKELKGDTDQESEAEYFDRKQKEWMEEKGLINE